MKRCKRLLAVALTALLSAAAAAALPRPQLVEAVGRSDADTVAALLRDGANVNERDEFDWSPLMLAARTGDLAIVALLLNAGADPNAGGTGDWMPLHIACENGHFDVVKALIDAGADVNVFSGGTTPLTAAALIGDLPLTELLLEAGARIEERGDEGVLVNAVVDAAASGNRAVFDRLVQAGGSITKANGEGLTPLIAAAGAGDVELVEHLLKAGYDVNAVSERGESALTRGSHHSGVVALLLAAGARTDAPGYTGANALICACRCGNTASAQLLLKAGANANAADIHGLTPLMAAAQSPFAELADLLLDAGAVPDARNEEGYDAWHFVQNNEHFSAAEKRRLGLRLGEAAEDR